MSNATDIARRLRKMCDGTLPGEVRDHALDAAGELERMDKAVDDALASSGRDKDSAEEARAALQWQLQWSKSAPELRHCQQCGADMERRDERETRAAYRRRKFCGRSCAGAATAERHAASRLDGMGVADAVDRLVNRAGLSQAQAAKLLGVSRRRVAQVVRRLREREDEK